MLLVLIIHSCTYLSYVTHTSFSDRILIANGETWQQLLAYARKGLDDGQMEELLKLTKVHAPFLTDLIEYVKNQSHVQDQTPTHHQCLPKWKNFFQCIGIASPVCALVPASDEAEKLMKLLCEKDITADPDVCTKQ